MNQKHTIVVGVDGSETGRHALGWALDEAARTGSEVRAVTAWSADMSLQPGLYDPKAAAQRAGQILANEVLAVTADRPESVPVRQEAIEGDPAGTLVAAASEAAMLVLGSHGHSRVFQAVLGSVTAECVRHAACPVVVIPPPHRTPPRKPASAAFSAPLY
jgi:nucleotide-binding universal stress UspA family protein